MFSIEVKAEGGSISEFEFAFSIFDRFVQPISQPDEYLNSADGSLLQLYNIGDAAFPVTGSM